MRGRRGGGGEEDAAARRRGERRSARPSPPGPPRPPVPRARSRARPRRGRRPRGGRGRQGRVLLLLRPLLPRPLGFLSRSCRLRPGLVGRALPPSLPFMPLERERRPGPVAERFVPPLMPGALGKLPAASTLLSPAAAPHPCAARPVFGGRAGGRAGASAALLSPLPRDAGGVQAGPGFPFGACCCRRRPRFWRESSSIPRRVCRTNFPGSSFALRPLLAGDGPWVGSESFPLKRALQLTGGGS